MACTCNLGGLEVEAGDWRVLGQPKLHRKEREWERARKEGITRGHKSCHVDGAESSIIRGS